MYTLAMNFDPVALMDDGSCIFLPLETCTGDVTEMAVSVSEMCWACWPVLAAFATEFQRDEFPNARIFCSAFVHRDWGLLVGVPAPRVS